MSKIYLPTLRGYFGDWVYYSSLMPAKELADRVEFATLIHVKNPQLSEMIQRELREGRAVKIADYLETDERFFNSLVIAVYGGDPAWHEFGNIRPSRPDISMDDIPGFARNSLGFLSFSGTERLYALDGQHRLAGIKEAVRRGEEAQEDEVSVVFVAHKNTVKGMERTRRLFTTLNRRAVPISKFEGIALDEDDVMAIVTRRLVEQHPFFSGNRISYIHTPNLPQNDFKTLTTITNLYDVVTVLFSKWTGQKPAELQLRRPEDEDIEKYYKFAVNYFTLLKANFRPLAQFFDAKDHGKVVAKNRGSFGGHILFRPAGLLMFTEIISSLHISRSMRKSVELAATLPQQLDEEPIVDLLWVPSPPGISNKRRSLVRELMLYALGAREKLERLAAQYAKATDTDLADALAYLAKLREETGSPAKE